MLYTDHKYRKKSYGTIEKCSKLSIFQKKENPNQSLGIQNGKNQMSKAELWCYYFLSQEVKSMAPISFL